MSLFNSQSRRGFLGGLAGALGYLGLKPGAELWARDGVRLRRVPPSPLFPQQSVEQYDAMAKLASNENPWGPPESVMKAMNSAWKYANRYGYPDGNVQEEIAKHHGVDPDNILLGAGSGEILEVVAMTYLGENKKVVGVEPTYATVFQVASGVHADAIQLPLLPDYRQDIPAMIRATRLNYREVGFVYLCNPNNPTGIIITAQETKQLLDGIPQDIPVLIDEAYHHFVTDPAYAEAIPYVKEGRNVIVARTFSKIVGLAGMRLGYAVAPREIIQRMRTYSTGSTNALVKWGAAAAFKDTAAQEKVKRETIALREKTVTELRNYGYDVIPSQTNFFMVHIKRPVQPVIQEFRQKGVAVGRPFPPMTQHLRVSIGLPEEMNRFMVAFKEIFPRGTVATSSGG